MDCASRSSSWDRGGIDQSRWRFVGKGRNQVDESGVARLAPAAGRLRFVIVWQSGRRIVISVRKERGSRVRRGLFPTPGAAERGEDARGLKQERLGRSLHGVSIRGSVSGARRDVVHGRGGEE